MMGHPTRKKSFARRWEETAHEYHARLLFAATANKSERHFRVIRRPKPDTWYDFADVATGKCGQCRMNRDGTWHQAPTGDGPVILAYWPRTRSKLPFHQEIAATARAAVLLGELKTGPVLHGLGIVVGFAKKGAFAGTVKAIPGQDGTTVQYTVNISGLNEKRLERLCQALKRL